MPSTASTPEWHYRSVVPASGPDLTEEQLRDSLVDLLGRAVSIVGGIDISEGHAIAHVSARHYVPLGTRRPSSPPRLDYDLGYT